MKGAIFKEIHHTIVTDELEKPSIQSDEVLIKVKFVGICGSDVENYHTGKMGLSDKIIGHEFSGEVVEVGSAVRKIKLGTRVTANPGIACGECYWCLHALENMCKLQNYSLGTTEHGAMREYVNVKAERLHILPDKVSYEEGATVEPLAVAVYAVQESGLKLGDTAAVFGAGSIGLMVLQVLKVVGASYIYVIEPVESKKKRALKLGADKVLDPKSWAKIIRMTDRVGPDHVFDCVGIPQTIMNSIALVKRGGHITMIGLHAGSFEMRGFMGLSLNNITMRGVYGYNQDTFKTSVRLFEQKKISIEDYVTNKISVYDVPAMFKKLANPPHEEIKVLVEF